MIDDPHWNLEFAVGRATEQHNSAPTILDIGWLRK